ncbi:MAG: TetR/AcrR family transcriptional regulator [Candidatus Omnitrophica bacterium]|nr:TetR/AcrR family transcriptional regulator [Candidatus Omnitrophota bacterium]MCB9720174.1 TetR/AcrR family transcriptional regulator [Candidatus Omnitrophota bacterium]
MSKSTIQRGTARDRILAAASDLFYRQGYNATGIQQIIDEAGVSKGTFYTHFKTKDDLGLAYLNQRNHEESTGLRQMLAEIKDPYQRYLNFNTIMKEWMKSSGYRGCAFSNMSAEVPDGNSPIRKMAKFHYEGFRAIIRDVVEDLLKSDAKYKGLNVQYVADQYMITQVGALLNSEIYQDEWPYVHAEKAIRALIGEKV